MSKFTKRELEIMVGALALDKGLDFLTGGSINRWSRKQALNIVKKVLPAALRVAAVPAASIAGSAARAALPLVTNPYLAGTALGLGALEANSSLRMSISKYTTEKDIDYVLDRIKKVVIKLRKISPLVR